MAIRCARSAGGAPLTNDPAGVNYAVMAQSRHPPGVRIKRAYLPASADDGIRILVDRIWPRGLRKKDAAIARWIRDVAPSTELRHWFAHDPARWEEFARRYRAELKDKADLLKELRGLAHHHTLTLVYAARDEQHNQAVVLQKLLRHGIVRPPSS